MFNELLTEKVLRLVEAIPRGCAVSYGQLASVVGTGPRQIGAIMATHGSPVPWWRVVNTSGHLPASLATRARAHWVAEDTPLLRDGDGVSLRLAGVDTDELQALYKEVAADLPK